MRILLGISWIETYSLLNKRDSCQRISRVDLGIATRSVRLRVVRVKRQRSLTLSLRPLEVPFPRRHSCGNPMRKRYFRAFLHCKVREMLCDIEYIWRAGQMIMEVEKVRPAQAGILRPRSWVEIDRAPQERDDGIEYLAIPFPTNQDLPPPKEKVVSLNVCGLGRRQCGPPHPDSVDLERIDNVASDFVLDGEDVSQVAVVPLRP